jgi:formylglycine-generating enzyme required for sulfatase activity
MATRQAWGGWAVVLAAAVLFWEPGCSSQAERSKELNLDLGGGVTMKLALIPAGKFMMGSPESEWDRYANEGPQHEVTISKPFYLGVYEVTQEQYQALMGRNPSYSKGPTNPVELVSWDDAREFCRRLSEKTGRKARLPTEAEWEYACRAGTRTRFSFGDADGALGDYAWYGDSRGSTHPVGQKKPNPWGLYDMHGNVGEWCGDWYGEYTPDSATDPTGPISGSERVERGGTWGYDPWSCRSAWRGRSGDRNTGGGFRVVVPVGVE